jgi:hypothetical protein
VEGRKRLSRWGAVQSTPAVHHFPLSSAKDARSYGRSIVLGDLCESGLSFGRDVSMPLGGRPGGLVSFELVGFALGHLVRARWDGVELRMTEQLCQMVLMSEAVEDVFRADEEEDVDWSNVFAERVAVDLVGSMDAVAMVEYSMAGSRTVARRIWFLGGIPVGAPSDRPHAEW